MAMSMPVVATKSGAVEEIVKEILVEEKNPQQLAEALTKLLDDEELRKQQGERNRKIVEEYYSKKNIDKLFDFHKRGLFGS